MCDQRPAHPNRPSRGKGLGPDRIKSSRRKKTLLFRALMCGNGERGRAEIRSPGNGGPICRGNIIKAWGTEALGLN
ncbi:uncharacterized [Tachysurus ichikawai]